MKCNACGNERNFVVKGNEVRMIDALHPTEVDSYFVVSKAACANPGCSSFPCTDITLDPIHPNLVPFKDALGL